MEAAIGQYGSNLKEIERVTQKQRVLLDLKLLKEEEIVYRKDWVDKRLRFTNQEVKTIERDLINDVKEYVSVKQHVAILVELLNTEITEIEGNIPIWKEAKQIATNRYEEVLPSHKQIDTVNVWLRDTNLSVTELELQFENDTRVRFQLDVLEQLTKELKLKKVEKEFEQINDKKSFELLNKFISDSRKAFQDDIDKKEILKKFANVNDPHSLAYWAIHQERPLSLEEESMVIRFQDLPREKPADSSDYLPIPGELFADLRIEEKESGGFWLNLKGIQRFVPYTAYPIFNTTDKNAITSYFEAYTNTIEEDIKILRYRLSVYKTIQEIILSLKTPLDSLNAYNQKEILLSHKQGPLSNISKENFETHIKSFKGKDAIEKTFGEAKIELDEITGRVSSTENTLRNLKLLKARNTTQDNDAVQEVLSSEEFFAMVQKAEDNYEYVRQNIKGELTRAGDKEEFFQKRNYSAISTLSKSNTLPEKKRSLDEAIVEFNRAVEFYKMVNGSLPESYSAESYVTNPTIEHEAYIRAEQSYLAKYKGIIEQYIPSERFRFQEINDFRELAKYLLPEAFHDVIVAEKTESDLIETVATYLNRINDKNKLLNNRKIQKIKDLLHEVDVATSEQENIIRRIDNFLKNETSITGGYKARLKRSSSTIYPKEWMTVFRENLEDNATGLTSQLAEKIDLENMITTAFLNCGGHQSTDVSINKLLDPSVYYDLEFKMESSTGRVNKGSTGQTYAAIALLCIARLSVMSKDEEKKIQPAVRIMPIDEAEGLGSNYDMLYNIAKEYDYQLLSLSISPVGKFKDGEQFLYMLHKNMEVEEPVNYTPMAILCETDKTKNEL